LLSYRNGALPGVGAKLRLPKLRNTGVKSGVLRPKSLQIKAFLFSERQLGQGHRWPARNKFLTDRDKQIPAM
jgi:hypothetical protein